MEDHWAGQSLTVRLLDAWTDRSHAAQSSSHVFSSRRLFADQQCPPAPFGTVGRGIAREMHEWVSCPVQASAAIHRSGRNRCWCQSSGITIATDIVKHSKLAETETTRS